MTKTYPGKKNSPGTKTYHGKKNSGKPMVKTSYPHMPGQKVNYYKK